MSVPFVLTRFVKEGQLQHGLRGEDYVRYCRYLTHRVRTLRRQLKVNNTRKRFLRKKVPDQFLCDDRALMLLILYAERCWAEAEVQQEQTRRRAGDGGGGNGVAGGMSGGAGEGGVAPRDQHRKRLNKATKWTSKLCVEARHPLVSQHVRYECLAYDAEMRGRAAVAHGGYAKALRAFVRARVNYSAAAVALVEEERVGHQRRKLDAAAMARYNANRDESLDMLTLKLSEMDDRAVYCMQHLGKDVNTYTPQPFTTTAATAAAAAAATATAVLWHGHVLSVGNIRLRDALREARAVPVEAAQAKLHDATTTTATAADGDESDVGAVLPVGQVTKVLELFDRRIGYYNDALAHARQALRGGGGGGGGAGEGTRQQQIDQQLLTHYFLYQVEHTTAQRALFLADVYERRFRATERALRAGAGDAQTCRCATAAARAVSVAGAARTGGRRRGDGGGRRAELAPAQYASPLEVVRLYEAALEAVEKMQLLPGVVEHDDGVAALHALCRAGKLLYTGEAWRVVGAAPPPPPTPPSSSSSGAVSSPTAAIAVAASCYRAALAALAHDDTPQAHTLRLRVERAALRMAAERALTTATSRRTRDSHSHSNSNHDDNDSDNDGDVMRGMAHTVAYLTDAKPSQAAVALGVMRFPPDYQTVPCKPTFLDIASTYVRHVPTQPTAASDTPAAVVAAGASAVSLAPDVRAKDSATTAAAAAASSEAPATRDKRWRWRWGWGGGGDDAVSK